MFPGIYGFTWDTGNLIFLGIFFTVAAIIAGTVTLAAVRAYKDHMLKKHEAIEWAQDFHDLPQSARICRHVLTGELKQRRCPHGFDCRACDQHQALVANNQADDANIPGKKTAPQPIHASGFRMPLDRLYHRGHTWV